MNDIDLSVLLREGAPEMFVTSCAAKAALDFFQYTKVDTLIDIGCGLGRDSIYFARNDLSVTGVDSESKKIQRANKFLRDTHLYRLLRDIRFRTGNATNLPFEDGQFDAAFCNMMYHTFNDQDTRDDAAKDMLRVLRPRGLFFVSLFSKSDPSYNPDTEVKIGVSHHFDESDIERTFSGCFDLFPQEVKYSSGDCSEGERPYWHVMGQKLL